MGGNNPGTGITPGPHMTFGYITARQIAGPGVPFAPANVASAAAATPSLPTSEDLRHAA